MKKAAILFFATTMIFIFAACSPSPPSSTQNSSPPEDETALADLPPMVRVDGILYYHTGTESTLDGRCGTLDDEITACVDRTQTPIEDNQSNFGTGYGYQIGKPGTIEVLIDKKWIVFAAEETESICGYPTYQDMQKGVPPA